MIHVVRQASWPVAVCAVLLSSALQPQEPIPSLSGVVVAARDGKPIKRAEVILRPVGAGIAPMGVTTDDKGQFAFFKTPPGRYTLYATHDGFLPSSYVLFRDARLLLPFALSDKQSMDGLILLPPGGVLSGKVLHYHGEVASRVVVEAYRGYFDRGRHIYDTAGRAMTNDRASIVCTTFRRANTIWPQSWLHFAMLPPISPRASRPTLRELASRRFAV